MIKSFNSKNAQKLLQDSKFSSASSSESSAEDCQIVRSKSSIRKLETQLMQCESSVASSVSNFSLKLF